MIKGKYIIKSDGKIIAEKENIITTNGFYMINRHLVKSNIDWAGSLVIGTLPITPSISDKELYYEIDRVPITLKSYTKMSPRYTVLSKQITSNVAYLTFKSITTPILASGYKIQITGVDSTLNGTYNINSYAPLQATITGVTASTGTITFTANNSFTAGETVTITGVNPTSYNITGTIASASSTQFTVVNAATGSYVSGGTAVQQYAYQIQYSKTASDVSLTQISSNTALVSVLADASGTSIYNNEIVVKGTLDPNLAARIYEVGVIPINLKQASLSSLKNLTGFSEKSTTDSSLSQWVNSSLSQVPLIGQATINGGSSTQQSGYTWITGTANVTFNVSNTAGLKVGSNVYVSGTTAATGSTLAPSGSATVASINGNYQLTLTMGSTNSTGSTQYGYGGTISLNTTALGQPSSYGQFNVQLNTSDTLTLSNIVVDATAYSSSDSLLLSYYSPIASNGIALTISLTDNNNTASPFTTSVSNIVASAGLNIVRFPLPSTFPSVGITINQIAINMSAGPGSSPNNYIYLDGLKIVTNDYWTAHPYAGTSTITTVTAGSPASGYVTYTTSAAHNYSVGNTVSISGITGGTPSGGFSNVITSTSVTGTSGTNTLTVTSPTGTLAANQLVSGAGVPVGTIISSVSGTGPYTVTMNNNLTTAASGTYTFTSTGFVITAIPSRTTFVVANATTGTATLSSPSQSVSSTVVTLPPEYQLTSRSIFTNPIKKYTGQQMDIEYHLQVT